jgi:hypothetical protein
MKMNGNQTGKSFGSGAHRQCAAKSKRSGERCRAPAVTGRYQCRMHGGILSKEYHGAAVSGPDSPNWRHGLCSVETFREEAALRVLSRAWRAGRLSAAEDAEFQVALDRYYAKVARVNQGRRERGERPILPGFRGITRYRYGYTGDRPQCHSQLRDEHGRFS